MTDEEIAAYAKITVGEAMILSPAKRAVIEAMKRVEDRIDWDLKDWRERRLSHLR